MASTDSIAASWLNEIEAAVKQKSGEAWGDTKWTEFVKEVAWWLRSSRSRDGDADIVVAATGLITYGVSSEEDLQQISNDKRIFRDELKAEGIRPAVCNSLFDKYVAPQHQLRLFQLVFRTGPAGSSGVPHIHKHLDDFPMDLLKMLPTKQCNTPLLRRHHQSDKDGNIYYSRQIQVQFHLENVVKDVIESCDYSLVTDTEAALNGLKIDIGMIRNENDSICGTIEVKQPKRENVTPPDPNPLIHPKVVTQVLSQMIPLRTVYGVKNVYGILSTYKCWRFFRWVPEGEVIDDESNETAKMLLDLSVSESQKKQTAEENAFETPSKNKSKQAEKSTRVSPPTSPRPFRDSADDREEDDGEQENDSAPNEFRRGTLYASEVISDEQRALGVLAWVLGEMNRSPVDYVPAHERDYLYVVQRDGLGGYEKVEHTPLHYKGRMPRPKNTSLYILEELGHRHKGRVYRAMSKNGNLCVLKYFVKSQNVLQNGKRVEADAERVARKAVDYWDMAYANDKFLPSAALGKWGGGEAIIMPDLEKMSVDVDRQQVLGMLVETMQKRFYEKGIWHGDPAWGSSMAQCGIGAKRGR